MAPNHLLPVVVCSLAVVVLFLWLSSGTLSSVVVHYLYLECSVNIMG